MYTWSEMWLFDSFWIDNDFRNTTDSCSIASKIHGARAKFQNLNIICEIWWRVYILKYQTGVTKSSKLPGYSLSACGWLPLIASATPPAQSLKSSTLSQIVSHQLPFLSSPSSAEGDSLAALVGVADGSDVWTGGPAVVVVWTGGSEGVSRTGAVSSECRPTGFNGRRRVPLLGRGSTPKESQRILYTSTFSSKLC